MRKFALLSSLALSMAYATPVAAQIVTAQVTGGTVVGSATKGLGVFRGVPFMAPPVGAKRWRAPQAVTPWIGTKITRAFAPACPQAPSHPFAAGTSEDCLYLNVWTPAKTQGARLPVMVWIHGGGFSAGMTRTPMFDGVNLAHKGVIVVSIAYRLGVLGFLAHPALTAEQGTGSGNYGLLDQLAALHWIKRNIAAFGGDPANVTLFGESAGASLITMLNATTQAKDLYSKAITESGADFVEVQEGDTSGFGMTSLSMAEQLGKTVFAEVGAHDLASARALPADRLVAIDTDDGSRFRPDIDGRLMTADQLHLYATGRFNRVPFLVGTNSDEGAIFIPPAPAITTVSFIAMVRSTYGAKAEAILAQYPHATDAEAKRATKDLFRDANFAWSGLTLARALSGVGGQRVYSYYFDKRSPKRPDGAHHGDEQAFVFGNLDVTNPFGPTSDRDRQLANQMGSYWVNFARTGDPNGRSLPHWPAFTGPDPRAMLLGDRVGSGDLPHQAQLRAIDAAYPGALAGQ